MMTQRKVDLQYTDACNHVQIFLHDPSRNTRHIALKTSTKSNVTIYQYRRYFGFKLAY